MIAAAFDYFAPKTLDETLALLDTHGSACKVLAGGMTLVPVMTLGLVQPGAVVSLNHVAGLDAIEDAGDVLRLGAMVRHATLARHPLVRQYTPLLAAAAGGIGDVQVRHRGTLGGSLSHAEPAADYLCACAALGARFCLRSRHGERWLDVETFFCDVMTTALAPEELLTMIEIPKQPVGSGIAHLTLRRVEGAFPVVLASAAVAPGFVTARLGLGGIGPRPVALDITDALRGGLSDRALPVIGERAFAAAAHALSDLNGSSRYRREMARVYARRAVQAAVAHLESGARA
ncbi:MAG: xanthine dehydrogenase family protein subunit M [Gammaproteobacteria bacterium]